MSTENFFELQDQEQQRRHLHAVNKEQDQVKELLKRGLVRHYFLGPESIWTQEGFGTFVGGGLAVLFGALVFPKLFLYSSNSQMLKAICWIIAAGGIVACAKGLAGMIRESKNKKEPVLDAAFDEILDNDLTRLKDTAKSFIIESISRLELEEPVDEMEMILVKGPRDYVHNVNLPLLWKRGEEGRLRYSNLSVMALFFGEENLYLFTSIYNVRNGSSKFQHAYECPYHKILFAGFEDKVIETVNQQNKSVIQNLKMLVIQGGESEDEKLSMPVADYDVMKNMNGFIDNSDAEEALRMIIEKKAMSANRA